MKYASNEGWLWPFSSKPPYSKAEIRPSLITCCAAAACLDYIFHNEEWEEDKLVEKYGEDTVYELVERCYGRVTYFSDKDSVKSDMKYIKKMASSSLVAQLKSHKEWSSCMTAGEANADDFIEIVEEYFPNWK